VSAPVLVQLADGTTAPLAGAVPELTTEPTADGGRQVVRAVLVLTVGPARAVGCEDLITEGG
jgi:hypothetical protein